jgi:hypothetical protein
MTIYLIAGLFLGTALVLAYIHWRDLKTARQNQTERMLLMNKMFRREGQTALFPDSMIETGEIEGDKPAQQDAEPFNESSRNFGIA